MANRREQEEKEEAPPRFEEEAPLAETVTRVFFLLGRKGSVTDEKLRLAEDALVETTITKQQSTGSDCCCSSASGSPSSCRWNDRVLIIQIVRQREFGKSRSSG